MLRDLQSHLIGKLICIPGIITSTSKTQVRDITHEEQSLNNSITNDSAQAVKVYEMWK